MRLTPSFLFTTRTVIRIGSDIGLDYIIWGLAEKDEMLQTRGVERFDHDTSRFVCE